MLRHAADATAQEIALALEPAPPCRDLRYRLKRVVDAGRLAEECEGRWSCYRILAVAAAAGAASASADAWAVGEALLPLSDAAPGVLRPVHVADDEASRSS